MTGPRHDPCPLVIQTNKTRRAQVAGLPEGNKMKQDHAHTIRKALVAFILMITMMSAASAQAEGRDRKGLILGFNAGWGSAGFSSQIADRTLTDDPFSGAAGGLRFGYAFSNSFGLSLEGYGFGTDRNDEGWGLGAGFLTITWWPDGSGFFLRAGVGGGGGDVLRRGTGELVHFEDKGAGLFGLGYEWKLGRKFALGLAADGIGIDLENASGLEGGTAGLGVFSIQFNWYL
jgi:hypothetical protein